MTVAQDQTILEPQPLLPAELEKEIFEVLALSSLKLIPKLVLVSKRVRIWLEPLLYRHLSVCSLDFRRDRSELLRISSNECLEILDSKPASFLRDHVRYLALTNIPDATVERILSSCTEIRSLAIFQIDPIPIFLPLIQAAPLVHLSINVAQLCGPVAHFEPSAFTRLTHLEIFGTEKRPSSCWGGDLRRLPALTHLLVHCIPWGSSEPPFRDILAECRTLEVLIQLLAHEEDAASYAYFADDARAVTWRSGTFLDDCEKSMLGGEDHWFLADAFVHRRRTGQIAASEYAIPRTWRPYVSGIRH
ncbi:hypothetical protein MSAN_02006400 [Mycena sanguinolenta]|uniref:F-box domain-containing protein n=1 Tax=Mycena sanguinolenta TaxID=230812 RepID=A0A8H6XJT7_9AGAR|nr:hypothetical protein MSAN_02006400 [Mycena sanguinolenta]